MKRITALVAGVVMLAVAPAHAGTTTVRDLIEQRARAAGGDISQEFERVITTPWGDRTLGEITDALTVSGPVGNEPEFAAGSIIHIAYNFGSTTPIYTVSESATIPETPQVVVPVPSAPVLQPQSAFIAGGKTRQVRGTYGFGVHFRGGAFTNATLTVDGPVVSGLGEQVVEDRGIEFVGQTFNLVNVLGCVPDLCFALGMLFGSGSATFFNGPIGGDGPDRMPVEPPTIP